MKRTWIQVVLLVALSACGKSNTAPAPQAEQSPTTVPTTAPSGLSGEKKSLSLGLIPLRFTVPVEWKLEAMGGVTAIEGPLPGGEVQIVVSKLQPMTAKHTELWLQGATQPSDPYIANDLREINGLKVRESVSKPFAATLPSTPPGLNAQTPFVNAAPVHVIWRITILVPQGDQTIPCSLNLIEMTESEYQAQKAFIDSIINTVERE